jgi:predicted anti-sigma-YlaC factor YlaD
MTWLCTLSVMVTVGLAGLAITIGLLSMIALGQHHFGSVHVGQSIAFTAFALCLIVAALECRSETGSPEILPLPRNEVMGHVIRSALGSRETA